MSRRFHPSRLSIVGLCLAAAACGVEAPDAEAPDASRALAVQPRVVIDGGVELSARVDDRITIREVMLHAPSVSLVDADGAAPLLDDGDRLLFRYDIASTDGFGNVLGGERRWSVPVDEGGELDFAFAPFPVSELAPFEQAAGLDLGALAAHTVVVRGTLLTAASASASGFACVGDGACGPADGDPDGNPADTGAKSEGDPDGNPAEGDPDGNPADTGGESDGDPDGNPAAPADGDPDGNPARPSPEKSDGDPDGNPADGDPDGNPADGDPDGNPARSAGADNAQPRASSSSTSMRFADDRVAREGVPFTLVLNQAFSLRAPLAAVDLSLLTADEVLPIDLHVRLNELLSAERLDDLEARAATSDVVVLEVTDAGGALDIELESSGVRRRGVATGGGIRVVGR